MTSVPPFSNAPQISSVAASKAMGEFCRMRSSGPRAMKFCPCTKRRMARCGTTTPLGTPVEPEVYIT